jgi:hypothetical protein
MTIAYWLALAVQVGICMGVWLVAVGIFAGVWVWQRL